VIGEEGCRMRDARHEVQRAWGKEHRAWGRMQVTGEERCRVQDTRNR